MFDKSKANAELRRYCAIKAPVYAPLLPAANTALRVMGKSAVNGLTVPHSEFSSA